MCCPHDLSVWTSCKGISIKVREKWTLKSYLLFYFSNSFPVHRFHTLMTDRKQQKITGLSFGTGSQQNANNSLRKLCDPFRRFIELLWRWSKSNAKECLKLSKIAKNCMTILADLPTKKILATSQNQNSFHCTQQAKIPAYYNEKCVYQKTINANSTTDWLFSIHWECTFLPPTQRKLG